MVQHYEPRLYNDLAEWWPLISPPEEYVEEAEILIAILREKLGPGRHTLLDLGVGGGHHLLPLLNEFDATGVDLSADMLSHLAPSVEHHIGDMRTVRLEKRFDAVLIHDAVTYLDSEEDLNATLATVKAHLRPGGVLLMCPDWFQENFPAGFVYHESHSRADTKLTCIEYMYDPDSEDTSVELVMLLLIEEAGKLRVEEDRHILGLFPRQTWIQAISEAGFTAETRPFVKGVSGAQLELLVGVLPD